MIDRYVIPIYNIDTTEDYRINSSINDITFNILLKTYSRHSYDYALINERELQEVFKYGGNNSIKDFYNIMENDEHHLHRFTRTLLVIDFIRESTEVNYYEILSAIIDSFHLSIPNGLSYYKYFSFKSYSSNGFTHCPGSSKLSVGQTFLIHTIHSKPFSFSPMLKGEINLVKSDFVSVQQLIYNLHNLYTMKENSYSRIMNLTIDYHKLSRTFEKPEQAFLTLMLTVEAMFKENQKKELYKYIPFLSKLLSSTQIEYEKILYAFKRNEKNIHEKTYFIQIRNDIVHGDIILSKEEIKLKLLELYEYVRECILKILEINGKRPLINYYKDLFEETEKRWEEKINLTKESKVK